VAVLEYYKPVATIRKSPQYYTPLDWQEYTDVCWWPIGFYNGGKHLFLTRRDPGFFSTADQKRMEFLPFRQYCAGGNENGVQFRHLGHLYGLNGGKAHVEVSYDGMCFRFDVQAQNFIFLYDEPTCVTLYESRRPAFLPHVSRPFW
jgi:hypothetical protein